MAGHHYLRTNVQLSNSIVAVYAGKRVSDALSELLSDMTLYHGVRFQQVLSAVYEQGRKDGARSVFDRIDKAKGDISHRNPGQPKKKLKSN